jgi:hypothetical protein
MPKLDLTPGAPVYCKDGKCGSLAQVLVDPTLAHVSHIVIEDGFLRRRTRVVPIAAVTQATTGDIYLTLTLDEVNGYPSSVNDVTGVPVFPLDSGPTRVAR